MMLSLTWWLLAHLDEVALAGISLACALAVTGRALLGLLHRAGEDS